MGCAVTGGDLWLFCLPFGWSSDDLLLDERLIQVGLMEVLLVRAPW